LPEGLATPLLEGCQPLLVLSARTLHLVVVALAERAERILVALLRLPVALGGPRAADPFVLHLGARQELRVSAEQDVGAAAGHVGRDRQLLVATGLGDDVRLGLVV